MNSLFSPELLILLVHGIASCGSCPLRALDLRVRSPVADSASGLLVLDNVVGNDGSSLSELGPAVVEGVLLTEHPVQKIRHLRVVVLHSICNSSTHRTTVNVQVTLHFKTTCVQLILDYKLLLPLSRPHNEKTTNIGMVP
jgi:hypothetical protein